MDPGCGASGGRGVRERHTDIPLKAGAFAVSKRERVEDHIVRFDISTQLEAEAYTREMASVGISNLSESTHVPSTNETDATVRAGRNREHEGYEIRSVTIAMAAQVLARSITALPIAAIVTYLLWDQNNSSLSYALWAGFSFGTAFWTAYLGSFVVRCEPDGSRFWSDLGRWTKHLHLGPLVGLLWLIRKLPTALVKLTKWSVWGVVGLVAAIIVCALAYFFFRALAVIPVGAAIIIGAAIIASSINDRK